VWDVLCAWNERETEIKGQAKAKKGTVRAERVLTGDPIRK
jgi:hypothetical protein